MLKTCESALEASGVFYAVNLYQGRAWILKKFSWSLDPGDTSPIMVFGKDDSGSFGWKESSKKQQGRIKQWKGANGQEEVNKSQTYHETSTKSHRCDRRKNLKKLANYVEFDLIHKVKRFSRAGKDNLRRGCCKSCGNAASLMKWTYGHTQLKVKNNSLESFNLIQAWSIC